VSRSLFLFSAVAAHPTGLIARIRTGHPGTPQRPHFIARSAIGRRSRASVLGIAVLVKTREDHELQSE
jgi:hypothetical protein